MRSRLPGCSRRALQGAGAASAAPSTLALLTTRFPEGRERTRAVAYYGAVAGGGGSVGLILGGILTSWLSWRWGMFVNVPVASATAGGLGAQDELAHRISTPLTAGAAMLAIALLVVVALVRPRRAPATVVALDSVREGLNERAA